MHFPKLFCNIGTKQNLTILTSQQKQFADEYLIDLNATKAAIRAGYKPDNARSYASQLLDIEEIQEYISARQKLVSEKLGYTLEKVLNNFATTYDRCMQAEPVLDFEGNPTGEYKFDATNALRANENIGKHLGFYAADNKLTIIEQPLFNDTDGQ